MTAPGAKGPRHGRSTGREARQAPEPARCPRPGGPKGRSASEGRGIGGALAPGAERGAPELGRGWRPRSPPAPRAHSPHLRRSPRPLRRGLSRSLSARSAAAPRAAHAAARARLVQPRRCSIPRAVLLPPPPPPPGAGGRGLGRRGLGSRARAVPAPPHSPARPLT